MILVLFLIFLSIYMMARNFWVFRERRKINERWFDRALMEVSNGVYRSPAESSAEYGIDHYISYNQMMLYFWCWDIEKMKKTY